VRSTEWRGLGPVRVAVDQRWGIGGLHPPGGCGFVHIGPILGHLTLLVCLACIAHLAGLGEASIERVGQESSLPGRLSNLGSKAQVGLVGQAQRIAVDQQEALAPGIQQGRVAKRVGMAGAQHGLTEKEVPVADHDAKIQALRGLVEQVGAVGLIGLLAHVVTDPGLEEVSEDEHRIGWRAAQVT